MYQIQERLKPCRSPYCECDKGRCSHPGFYDARHQHTHLKPRARHYRLSDSNATYWAVRAPNRIISDVRVLAPTLEGAYDGYLTELIRLERQRYRNGAR